jgi:hypothetical protein
VDVARALAPWRGGDPRSGRGGTVPTLSHFLHPFSHTAYAGAAAHAAAPPPPPPPPAPAQVPHTPLAAQMAAAANAAGGGGGAAERRAAAASLARDQLRSGRSFLTVLPQVTARSQSFTNSSGATPRRAL